MRSKSVFLLFFSFYCISTLAQWRSINPGAGGQVQDVVCDPNIEGRLFLASDMEGIYVSEDNGESWHSKGDLLQNRVYSIAITPGNSRKIFVGTLYGLEISNDGGASFDLVEITRKKSIGAIAISPHNPSIIIAGLGWRDDLDFSDYFGMRAEGTGELFLSTDGGHSWKLIIYDTDPLGQRNVISIQFDAKESGQVYIGTTKGVFKSVDNGNSWGKINSPEKTSSNWGVALSPDGKVLYATYSVDDKTGHIYATATDNLLWQKVTNGNGLKMQALNYWYPEVDPRSTGEEHKLVVGLKGSREGLFEGTFHWKIGTLSDFSWETIWSGVGGYDIGWDYAHPNPRFVHYTPPSWKRAIWSTTNQTIFEGLKKKDFYVWNNKYATPNFNFQVPHWESYWPTYTSKGTESTYTYDIAASKNYVIQGQADNGLMESWDYGKSWSNMQHRLNDINLSDVQSVAIATGAESPIVIAQATGGYGGGAVDGRLYIKELINHSPTDKWHHLAGGPEQRGGMPAGIYRDIAVSPAKLDRVFAFSTNNGLYLIDDIHQAVLQSKRNQPIEAEKISNGILDQVLSVKKIAPHPKNPDVVYLNATAGNQGVYMGKHSNGMWEWNKIYEGSGWDAEVTTWEFEERTYLFYSGLSAEKGGDGKHFVGALSLDEGKTWKTVFDRKMAQKLKSPTWYSEIKADYTFGNKGGIVGYENYVIMSFYDHRMQKSYGVFKGEIDGKGNLSWDDITDNLAFGGLTSATIITNPDEHLLYISTAGAGSWVRSMPRSRD